MNTDVLINKITSEVSNLWPDLYKIRYIYLELGKVLYKNTDFFFRVKNKINDDFMTFDEIKKVFYDRKENGGDYSVICRSAAEILHKAFDKVGINSTIIETNIDPDNKKESTVYSNDGENLEVHHFFLTAHDKDNNCNYFLTLAADLPYIQMGMQTLHFATNIDKKRTGKNGTIFELYDGKEIPHKVLNKEELKSIDLKIGYIKTLYNQEASKKNKAQSFLDYNDYSFKMIQDAMIGNNLFYFEEEKNTEFYKEIINQKVNLYDTSLKELTNDDWNSMIEITLKSTENKIENLTGHNLNLDLNNYNEWLQNICFQLSPYFKKNFNINIEEFFSDDIFNYPKFSKFIKENLNKFNVDEYHNIIIILDKCNALVNKFLNHDYKFSILLNRLSYHFIEEYHLPEFQKNYAENKYLANKFNILFCKLFNCNNGINILSNMQYSEQIVIIKKVLELMFPELNYENCSLVKNYNDSYSPVENRIQSYVIKSKIDSEYSIIFNIIGLENEADYYFLYNPKTNEFKVINYLMIPINYVIVSDRLKNKLENIEDIENRYQR